MIATASTAIDLGARRNASDHGEEEKGGGQGFDQSDEDRPEFTERLGPCLPNTSARRSTPEQHRREDPG